MVDPPALRRPRTRAQSKPVAATTLVVDRPTTRDVILHAAARIFAEVGFVGASTHRIAEAAGLKQGHLSYYFKSKEDLWKATVQQVFAADFSQPHPFDVEHERDSEAWTLEHEMRLYARFCADNPAHAQIMFHEISSGSPRLKWFAEHRMIPSYQRFKILLERDERLGHLKAHAAAVFAAMIFALSSTFAMSSLVATVTGEDPASPDNRERFVEGLIATFFSKGGST